MLYIVPTPIGNLKDISLRALEELNLADEIICEDSRRTSLLLNHYHIQKPLVILNDFNEGKNISSIVEKLKSGKNLALVSDAGTPLIQDPGYKLVRECINQNIEVDSLPGPTAAVTALTLSGLPPDKFFFLGYLPEKSGKRLSLFQSLQTTDYRLQTTFIFYIAPFKLVKPLEEMQNIFGDINLTLAKELTKVHQSVSSKKVSEWLQELKQKPPKGEYVGLFRLD